MHVTDQSFRLTDDAVRENWEMYGNPDGQQAAKFGIALPAWIVDENNSSVVSLITLIDALLCDVLTVPLSTI